MLHLSHVVSHYESPHNSGAEQQFPHSKLQIVFANPQNITIFILKLYNAIKGKFTLLVQIAPSRQLRYCAREQKQTGLGSVHQQSRAHLPHCGNGVSGGTKPRRHYWRHSRGTRGQTSGCSQDTGILTLQIHSFFAFLAPSLVKAAFRQVSFKAQHPPLRFGGLAD